MGKTAIYYHNDTKTIPCTYFRNFFLTKRALGDEEVKTFVLLSLFFSY